MPKAYRNEFLVPASGKMPDVWWRWLMGFLNGQIALYAGRAFVLEVHAPKRSLSQNAKLHALLAKIARGFVDAGLSTMHIIAPSGEVVDLPVTMEAVKLYYKALYGPRDEAGEIRSTASYTTTEMADFITCLQEDPMVVKAGIYLAETA